MKILFRELRQAYELAVTQKKECFNLRGVEFFTVYVKYMLEYLISLGLEDNDSIDIGERCE